MKNHHQIEKFNYSKFFFTSLFERRKLMEHTLGLNILTLLHATSFIASYEDELMPIRLVVDFTKCSYDDLQLTVYMPPAWRRQARWGTTTLNHNRFWRILMLRLSDSWYMSEISLLSTTSKCATLAQALTKSLHIHVSPVSVWSSTWTIVVRKVGRCCS